MRYSVWLEPTANDSRYLSKIIKHLARKYGAPIFAPHITLYGGIRRYVQARNTANACNDLSKIRVVATRMRHSDCLWKTLYLEIKKDKDLQRINGVLKTNLTNKYEFAPHISLIYKTLDSRTKRRIAKDLNLKRSYKFDKITIIRSSKTVSKWKKLKTINLKD
jgi:2'-5' RNA ligase